MKKVLLSVVFLLGFLFTTGFSTDPDSLQPVTMDKDSTTIEVNLQNNFIISDERTAEVMDAFYNREDSLSVEFLNTANKTADNYDREVNLLEQDQERRYESTLDYLSRETGIPSDEIETNLKSVIQKRTILEILYWLFAVSGLTIWWLATRNKLLEWQQRVVQLIVLAAFTLALYLLYCAILRSILPLEYRFINEILNLSSG